MCHSPRRRSSYSIREYARSVSDASARRHPRRGARRTAPASVRALSHTCQPKDMIPRIRRVAERRSPYNHTPSSPRWCLHQQRGARHTSARTGTCGRSQYLAYIAQSRTAPSASSRTPPSPSTPSSSLTFQRQVLSFPQNTAWSAGLGPAKEACSTQPCHLRPIHCLQGPPLTFRVLKVLLSPALGPGLRSRWVLLGPAGSRWVLLGPGN